MCRRLVLGARSKSRWLMSTSSLNPTYWSHPHIRGFAHDRGARGVMSQMSQQRRFGHVPTMSGLPLTADIVASIGDGREGQKPK
jgi:hypothetical protein